MTTVDDVITSFSDDPNLLNVAVSRAKSQFYLVVSGNEQPKDCNISDLIAISNITMALFPPVRFILYSIIYMSNIQMLELPI